MCEDSLSPERHLLLQITSDHRLPRLRGAAGSAEPFPGLSMYLGQGNSEEEPPELAVIPRDIPCPTEVTTKLRMLQCSKTETYRG